MLIHDHFQSGHSSDIGAALDRGEVPGLMEPMVLAEGSRHRAELTDLALELARRSAGFRRSLPPTLLSSLATLVRTVNCYYSNLIEGHETHPIDIERAVNGDFSPDANQRNLQLEAKAHFAVQEWIDAEGLHGRTVAAESIGEIHRRFYAALPEDLLWVDDRSAHQRIRMVPGALRVRDVAVGSHIAISAPAVPRFLKRFEEVYSRLGKTETVLATAAAHHRLLWVHPFLDGNGRVARLMSHATLLDALDTGAVWSVARGLALNVNAYQGHLAACDQGRRNDLDGRGNLSQECLAAFTRFFLSMCLDQVQFMEGLMQTDSVLGRIWLWTEEEILAGRLPQKSGAVIEATIYRGELGRCDAANIVGASEQQARRVIATLLERGVLVSATERSPLRLAFPAALAPRWMPGLFPDRRS